MKPITLPTYFLDPAKLLFPTLDFDRIHFYYQSPGTSAATTTFLTHTDIEFYGSTDDLAINDADFETWITLLHELCHALQGQSYWSRVRQKLSSLTCRIFQGQGKEDTHNCVEREAWEYEAKVRAWLAAKGVHPYHVGTNPGALSGVSYGFFMESAFVDAVAADPSIRKTSSNHCYPWDCWGRSFIGVTLGILITGLTSPWPLILATSDGVVGTVGGVVGGVTGAGAGIIVIGTLLGGLAGLLVGLLVGLIVGIVAGSLIGSIIDFARSIFGGRPGHLNFLVSYDQGLTFVDKVSFESSVEPMSLAFTEDGEHLQAGYTGTDNRVNVITFPYQSRWQSIVTFEESEDCGPAIAPMGLSTLVAWQGSDNHLNTIRIDAPGVPNKAVHSVFNKAVMPDEASPAICFVAGFPLVAATLDSSLMIHIWPGNGAGTWHPSFATGEHADDESSIAITSLGGNEFALAWVGADKHKRINVLHCSFDVATNTITRGRKVILGEGSDAGVALAFGAPFLYLAWTGTDDRVNIMRAADGFTFTDKRAFEKSRDDCGPALAVHPSGALVIGWTS